MNRLELPICANPSCGKSVPIKWRKYCDSCKELFHGGRRQENRWITNGYVFVRTENSPRGIAEHRLVMEKILGRPLKKGESVHHKDGNRSNNSPENLELWVGPIRSGQRACDIYCPHCGKAYQD